MWGEKGWGGGREHLGFLALDLTALLALWAAGGLAAPADFHRTQKKSHWSLKALKIFLGQSGLCLNLDSALHSSSCSCCLHPTVAQKLSMSLGNPNCKAKLLIKQLFNLLTPRHPFPSTVWK